MSEQDVARLRAQAEECRQQAERAINPLDKEAWLRWRVSQARAELRRPHGARSRFLGRGRARDRGRHDRKSVIFWIAVSVDRYLVTADQIAYRYSIAIVPPVAALGLEAKRVLRFIRPFALSEIDKNLIPCDRLDVAG